MKDKPNIFKYATSELSQDAFLCWLISWLEHPGNEELNNCAREFVTLLYNTANPNNKINSICVEGLIGDVKKQYEKIDIYFQAIIDKKIVSFIIEDKTHSYHHSNQLQRYAETVTKDNLDEDEIVLIYLKTGYLFSSDYEALKYGYHIVDLKLLNGFMQSFKINNSIFTDYQEYINELYLNYRDIIDRLIRGNDYSLFEYDFAQYEFIKNLSLNCTDYVNEKTIYNGVNKGGYPWTTLDFICYTSAINDTISEQIYYRIDFRKNTESQKWEYYLGLRQYASVKGDPKAKEEKVKRLVRYKEIFRSLEFENIKLNFAKVNNDWSGANESEIAILFFDGKLNTPSNVLNEIPKIHKQFVRKVKEYSFA